MAFSLGKWLGEAVSGIIKGLGDAIDKNVTNKGERESLKNETTAILLSYKQSSENELTERLKIDMSSDSWLSKNIRPSSLIYTTFVITILAIFDGNIGKIEINESYVDLFRSLLVLQYTFYFGSRALEKVMQMVYKNKK